MEWGGGRSFQGPSSGGELKENGLSSARTAVHERIGECPAFRQITLGFQGPCVGWVGLSHNSGF